MDLATLAGLGSLLTAALGAIGFFLAQGANLRKLIESGDQAVRDGESKARHALASACQRADDEMRRDVEQLKRESYRRDEAREMEGRIMTAVSRFEAKLDRQGEQIAHLLALDGSLKACSEQVRELMAKLAGSRA